MNDDPQRLYRRAILLRDYDHAQAGAYFSSICAKERACLFGDGEDGEMRLKECGEIVTRCWHAIPAHFPCVELDEFVVMPNHVHGILVITSDVRGRGEAFARASVESRASVYANASPLHMPRGTQTGSLNAVIRKQVRFYTQNQSSES